MKNREMTTNIGTINLAELELMLDGLEVFIPITTVSDRLKTVIDENIQKAKEDHQKEYLDGKGKRWSDTGINMDYQSLHITIEQGKKITYQLCFDFNDKKDEFIEAWFNLDVDLSEHTEEIKKLIVKAMIDKFF